MVQRKPKSCYSIGCIAGVVLILSCLAVCVWLTNWTNGNIEIAEINCGQNREIVITAARSWELSQPICYFVRVNGEIVIPTTYIDDNNPNVDPFTLRFTKFSTTDGNIVGITYSKSPSDYLVVHEFSTNASFPRGDHIQWDDKLDAEANRIRRDQARRLLEDKLNASRNQ